MADTSARRRGRSGRPKAKDAPRPAVRPAPDHDRDPALPTGAETPAPPPAEKTPDETTAPAATTTARARARAGTSRTRQKPRAARRPQPVDEGENYPRRITLPVTDDDYRALKMAQLDDDVNTVTRLRAMIDLWQSNSRWRTAVDRHARQL